MPAIAWKASGWRGPSRRVGLAAVALASAGILAAGCSSGSPDPSVAGASPPAASAVASASVSGEAEALAYAACMRSHGVTNFPDPVVKDGSVGFEITAGDGVDTNSATYRSARQACQNLRGGGTSNASSANLAKELKFAECMRTHGVPDFPDPNKNGGFSGNSSINPLSATFQNAQSTCMHVSGLGGGSGSSS